METDETKTNPTLNEIIEGLKKDPAPRHLRTRKQGKTEITYMPWAYICDYLDHYAPGWSWTIKVYEVGERLVIDGRLTVHGSDGSRTRSSTGSEKLGVEHYGDSATNAEAQALRRAACKFGFCRTLWQD